VGDRRGDNGGDNFHVRRAFAGTTGFSAIAL
jgi:hypothetical protein